MSRGRIALYAAVIVVAACGLFVGAAGLSFDDVTTALTDPSAAGRGIVMNIRLPRVLGALVVGATLATAGTAMQAVYRNRMADPYLLGVSSAAGFGFVIGALVGTGAPAHVIPVLAAVLAGLAGAWLTRRAALLTSSGDSLILLGVALGFVFLAFTLVMTFVADSPRLPTFAYFVFGSLGTVTWQLLAVAVPCVLVAVLIVASRARSLDILSIGDDQAATLGVDVNRLGVTVLTASGAAVGASVALAGVVGFVGLVAPLVARRWFGPFHRVLIPTSAALGALFVLGSDLLIRGFAGSVEVPLGVITAAIGGPVLVALLVREERS